MARLNMSPSPTLGSKSSRGSSRSMGTSVGKKQSLSSQDVIGSKIPIKTGAPKDGYTLGRNTKNSLK